MKVLLSAYACDATLGSEPAVGYETMMAVATRHEVWVITRRKNVRALTAHLEDHPLRPRIRLVEVDLSRKAMAIKKWLGVVGLQWYYDRWQVAAATTGSRLHALFGFDVMHHVTFSSDWARAGIATLPIPFVWGPIGGGVTAPRRLLLTLGWRGLLAEISRSVFRRALRLRPWYRAAWNAAEVVLVQNRETASLGPQARTVLLPNSTSVRMPPLEVQGRRRKEILVIGRLIPWKGGVLALRAFRGVDHREATLTFLGQGPDLRRLLRVASRWGLSGRVRFEGSLPRSAVIERVARAGAVLHTAVHEENSMAVGEALALGTPVVCLDWGGPAELLRQWRDSPGAAVEVSTRKATSAGLAQELARFLQEPPPIRSTTIAPSTPYPEVILTAYELALANDQD